MNWRAQSAHPIVIRLQSLGSALLLLLASLLLTSAAIVISYRSEQANLAEIHRLQSDLQQLRADLQQATRDSDIIKTSLTAYQQLLAQGRAQEEQRLDWIEAMGEIKTARHLLEFDYAIAPQRVLENDYGSSAFQFLASRMQLRMQLLHEGDLFDLLHDLALRPGPLLSIKQCSIERLHQQATPLQTANLKADCEIDWISLQLTP